jgi:hypothetical protein
MNVVKKLKESGKYEQVLLRTSLSFHLANMMDKLMSEVKNISGMDFQHEFKRDVLSIRKKTLKLAMFIDNTIQEEKERDCFADDLDFLHEALFLLFEKCDSEENRTKILSMIKMLK